MSVPATAEDLVLLIRKSGLVDEGRLTAFLQTHQRDGLLQDDPKKVVATMVRESLLTYFQGEQYLLGKWRGFTLGKYKLLERIGVGGMGQVFLCEHTFMRKRMAVKVLPPTKAEDPVSLGRFYREARVASGLEHPNIVRTYDIDQDGPLHFLVMEYMDGTSLLEIVKRFGPMNASRACHYIRQACMGLQYAHTRGMIHRDIKPGNILVDRLGVAKLLDMGLARFYQDEQDQLTIKYDDKNVLGTADYVAPEQIGDSRNIDIRADIYGMGATFYYVLTGQPPFPEATMAEKLVAHQSKKPKPIRELRNDVPQGVARIVEKMLAKDPKDRPQTPQEVVDALEVWTQEPISPPSTEEMPRLSPAATEPTYATAGKPRPASSSPSVPPPQPRPSVTPGMPLREALAPQPRPSVTPGMPLREALAPQPKPAPAPSPKPAPARESATPAPRPVPAARESATPAPKPAPAPTPAPAVAARDAGFVRPEERATNRSASSPVIALPEISQDDLEDGITVPVPPAIAAAAAAAAAAAKANASGSSVDLLGLPASRPGSSVRRGPAARVETRSVTTSGEPTPPPGSQRGVPPAQVPAPPPEIVRLPGSKLQGQNGSRSGLPPLRPSAQGGPRPSAHPSRQPYVQPPAEPPKPPAVEMPKLRSFHGAKLPPEATRMRPSSVDGPRPPTLDAYRHPPKPPSRDMLRPAGALPPVEPPRLPSRSNTPMGKGENVPPPAYKPPTMTPFFDTPIGPPRPGFTTRVLRWLVIAVFCAAAGVALAFGIWFQILRHRG